MTQLEKHEKAIRVLEAIDTCDRRIASLQEDIKSFPQEFTKWPKQRLATNLATRDRIQKYYNNNFKL